MQQTAMSAALQRVGLVTEVQVKNATCVPHHLQPYAGQIMEIERLTALFSQGGVEMSLLDIGATVAFEAMFKRKEYDEAYEMMLTHLKKVAAKHGLV